MVGQILFGTLAELQQLDFGPPLHSLVLCAKDCDINPVEKEVLIPFSLSLLSPYSLSIPSHQILDTFRVNEFSPRLTVVEVAEVADQDDDG